VHIKQSEHPHQAPRHATAGEQGIGSIFALMAVLVMQAKQQQSEQQPGHLISKSPLFQAPFVKASIAIVTQTAEQLELSPTRSFEPSLNRAWPTNLFLMLDPERRWH